ncbi:MAG TPA: putative phage abortive infection protein [Bryobacteraceae bacterium]|nr:putative phage abortive infection protein [Bryobacteraceae bacterium]
MQSVNPMPSVNDARPKSSRWRRHLGELLIVAGGLAAINFIFVFKAFRQTYVVDPAGAAQLGSFVGGYVGSMFSLVAVFLLYSTLKNQRLTSEMEHFETKYFELIKMHRDNVAEIELQGESGRKVFVLLIRELRCALEIVQQIAEIKRYPQTLNQQQALQIAFHCLFFGTGPNSSRMLKRSLSTLDATFIDAVDRELSNTETKESVKKQRSFRHTPFEGHQSGLGHYYRHLYQMVRYVDQQTLMDDDEKYEHVKTIRVQLSTHEQALLLVNSLAPMGREWRRKGFILKYRMVQNITREFFDSSTELDTNSLFDRGYFEWEEFGGDEAA